MSWTQSEVPLLPLIILYSTQVLLTLVHWNRVGSCKKAQFHIIIINHKNSPNGANRKNCLTNCLACILPSGTVFIGKIAKSAVCLSLARFPPLLSMICQRRSICSSNPTTIKLLPSSKPPSCCGSSPSSSVASGSVLVIGWSEWNQKNGRKIYFSGHIRSKY